MLRYHTRQFPLFEIPVASPKVYKNPIRFKISIIHNCRPYHSQSCLAICLCHLTIKLHAVYNLTRTARHLNSSYFLPLVPFLKSQF